MHSGLNAVDLKAALRGQFQSDGLCQYRSLRLIQLAHFSNVTREVALEDEVGQRFLEKVRRKNIHCMTDCLEAVNQIFGDDKISQAERRKQNFAECPYINHSSIHIQSVQGSNGGAVKAELAVIVVLDNPGAGVLRPVQELNAA